MADSRLPTIPEEPPAIPSHRVEQLNSLVAKEVAIVLARDFEFPGVLVTVSRVRVADDAESAKVWLSVLPESKSKDVLQVVTKRIRDIQRVLNKRLVMKFVPKLMFTDDRSNEKADRITRVLDSLDDTDLGTEK